MGTLLGGLKTFSVLGETALRKRILISLEIPSKDQSYQWVMQWIVQRNNSAAGGKSLFLPQARAWHHRGVETTFARDASGRVSCKFDFVPSTGKHWMRLGGFRFLAVERQRETKMVDLTTGSPFETLTLTTIAWPDGPKLFQDILNEARDVALAKEAGKTVIYKVMGHEWVPFGTPKEIRPFESVVLDGTLSQKIASDVREFLGSKDWYLQRGIPYRRGYLLHGPPGCGKSSFVCALAGLMKYSICVLNLGDPSMTDDRLQHLLAVLPHHCLVLLEDIDQVTRKFEEFENLPTL